MPTTLTSIRHLTADPALLHSGVWPTVRELLLLTSRLANQTWCGSETGDEGAQQRVGVAAATTEN
jgi:hypothetical protein